MSPILGVISALGPSQLKDSCASTTIGAPILYFLGIAMGFFAIFLLHILKKYNIFENFAETKKFFLANIYQSQFESYQVSKIEGPLTYSATYS